MKRISYLLLGSVAILASCKEPYKKVKNGQGIEYRIVGEGKGKKPSEGTFLEFEMDQRYKDSILQDTRDVMPKYQPYEANSPVAEVFRNAHVGDSIITRILTDSAFKNGNMPPFMKKGQYIYINYKLVNIFPNEESTRAAYMAGLPMAKVKYNKKTLAKIKADLLANAAQVKEDDKKITDYLALNKINAVKAPLGTYVYIAQPGTGEPLSDTSIAVVNYTGQTMDGKKFDSNVDTAFHHTEPFNVDMSVLGGVIPGWSDGLKLFKKGDKGTLYIPSSLAYGKTGNSGIQPNSNLIFDIEVVDVISQAQNEAIKEMQQKKQMEAQMMMRERMQNMQKQKADSSGKGSVK